MNFQRQLDILPPEQLRFPVHVVGCGGIGSMAALALGKMGLERLILYDDDCVSEHNLPNQFYRHRDLGARKTTALKAILAAFTDSEIETVDQRVEGGHFTGVVLVAVDTMCSRRRIWDNSIRFRPQVSLFVDARMGAEVARIYTVVPVDPDDVRFYETTLYSDAEAETLPCTQRAIVYNTLAISALVSNQIKKSARREKLAREVVLDLETLNLISR